jgi:glycosyltransferase involved in cell wall biosynthesis
VTLRVAIVSLYPAPGGASPGGVRTVVHNLVAALERFPDLELDIIHCHSDIRQNQRVEGRRLRAHYLAMPKRRILPNTLAAIPKVERLLRRLQPQAVNAHAAHYTVAALRAGYPTVYTIHGVLHREAEVYQRRLFDRLRLLLERQCEQYALGRVRDIVAISPYVLEEYAERSQARFHRIDNPLPEQAFSTVATAQAGRLLYVGTIDERKNVLGLMQALAQVRKAVPGVRLRVAGRAVDLGYEAEVRRYVATSDLGDCVRFLGLLNTADLLQEYQLCAGVVLFSRQETAPMAVIEAMAAGKPVVATRVGGVPDLVEDSHSGFLVDSDDVHAFSDRIAQLLTDEALRVRMGANAAALATRFRASNVAAQYRALYYQLAGRQIP